MSPSVDLPVPQKALAIGAHPDDIEFNCGGTLAKWAAAGCEIHLLVLTDGSKGSWDPSTDIAELIETRRSEARRAAQELGARSSDVDFLRHVDGELVHHPEIVAELCSAIRSIRPQIVLGHDPWKRYRLHPDHRAAGFLTCDAIVAAREPHYAAERSQAPHRPETLLLFEADSVDHVEGVSGFANHKIAALLAHESQLLSTMGISDSDDPAELESFRERIWSELREIGSLAGLEAGEAFKLLTGI